VQDDDASANVLLKEINGNIC